MKCRVCGREASAEGFCELHLAAYRNILAKYAVWKSASNVSWRQYLVDIQKNSLTGEWAKEVAKTIMEDESHNVK